ncbi:MULTISPECIES: Holliday junction resolvase RuvX [Leucobacter]|uniref:Putative pre-16S rRNA nuclease n=1 Tax=Leucobacter iarius TaxID=333963 RepID=A0ABP4XWC5_9MICO|nr:Holliday junction resolvase RuvX [Leucobacter sp. Ag1]KKI17159.1 Holliday junction resolvase [Leucobacter sp. Ag1]
MRTGVRLGIDVGRARIGVARSDAHGMLATPVETVRRVASGGHDVERIAVLFAEHGAFEAVVGLPLSLSGDRTPSTDDAEAFARRLAERGLPVRLVDERLSTVSAQSQLHQAGRNTKNSRGVIDQAAAVVILQHALDTERAQSAPPGEALDPQDADPIAEDRGDER